LDPDSEEAQLSLGLGHRRTLDLDDIFATGVLAQRVVGRAGYVLGVRDRGDRHQPEQAHHQDCPDQDGDPPPFHLVSPRPRMGRSVASPAGWLVAAGTVYLMSNPPFGFALPGSGGPDPNDPAQLQAMLAQLQQLLANPTSGPVNWELAKQVAQSQLTTDP